MHPYQEASEASRRSGEGPIQFLKQLGLSAASGAVARGGAALASSLIPKVSALINPYVPDNISRAGLEKIDPRFRKFIQGTLDAGYTYDDLRNFIGEKVKKAEAVQPPPLPKSSEKPKDERNIIQQYSPELHNFIDEEIRRGRRPIEAGAMAQYNKEFAPIIKMLSKEHKTPWSKIIESVYGAGEMAQAAQDQAQQEQVDPMLQKLIDQGNAFMGKFKGK